MEPLISVIVPIYKAEKYIYNSIDSIINQPFTDFELILVDDGSPDNCGTICDEYAKNDKRIKVIHKKNGGVSSARNIGIEKSSGKWICFVDSDDYLQPGFLMNPNEYKEDLIIQSYQVFGDENRVIRYENKTITENNLKDCIKDHVDELIYRVPWGKLFKSNIIKDNNIRFHTDIHIGEDTLFMLEYLYYTKSIKYNDSPMYMYKSDTDYSRYTLTPQKAVYIFNQMLHSYNKLSVNSINFIEFIFIFYWSLIGPDKSLKYAKEWYNDKNVKTVYQLVNKNLTINIKLKYYLYRIGLPSKYVEGTMRFIIKCKITKILHKLRKLLLPA